MKLTTAFIFSLLTFFSVAQDTSQWYNGWAPYYRYANAVEILDNGKFIVVGGWETNDSICTVSVSSDTGATWNIAMDILDYWLQDVDFTSGSTGYVVGWQGNVFKSTTAGDTWSPLTLTGNAASRNYNGCHFFDDNTGVIVGGNEYNDAIQTILRTTDGGSNWSIIRDNLAPWLYAVYFVDNNTGYAVGDNGTIIKSIDGGQSWNDLTVGGSASSRKFMDVYFVDANTGVAVGGWPDNDSIQTIVRTTDGGANWTIIADNLGSMLQGVTFYNATDGYAVGDDGVILFTDDAGATWTYQNIPNNDQWGFRDIYMKDAFLGLAGGEQGKLLWYVDTNAAIAQGNLFEPVTLLNANSVLIQGDVDDLGFVTNLELEYGPTLAFGTTVPMNPATTSGGGYMAIQHNLNGLTANQQYFARMKLTNTVGVSYSNIISFYTGLDDVPNFNFEFWDSFTSDVLDDWFNTGVVTKVSSYNGSFATQLNTTSGGETGAILHGTPGQSSLDGGVPFTERPDSLSFWADYTISPNDSALVLLQLKNAGTPIADTMYYITGNSGGWQNVKFGINYSSALYPDTVLIAFTNTNVFSGNSDPNSVIAIDDVTFEIAAQYVPNYNMEGWSTNTRNKADQWVSRDDINPNTPYLVEQSTDAFSGVYAVQISNRTNGGGSDFADIKVGNDPDNWGPAFPINIDHEHLYGYYKYNADSGDTLFVTVSMYQAGVQIAWGQFVQTNTITEYSLFDVPINYWGSNADSCNITVRIYNGDGSSPGASSAIIDNLSFGVIVEPVGIEEMDEVEMNQLVVYPNPTNGPLNFKFENAPNSEVEVFIFDRMGRKVMEASFPAGNEHIEMQLNELTPELYYVQVLTDNNTYVFKTNVK